jgi:hypothetical protein
VHCDRCTRSSEERLDLDAPGNIRAGPLVLYAADQYARSPRSEFAPVRRAGTLYNALKLLAVVEGSRAVTLAIPPAQQPHAALLYAARRSYSVAEKERGLAQLRDGHAAVRFEPYRRGSGTISEVPGGFVVAGARCLPIDIWVAGSHRPIRREISFGRHDSC